jgi:hypothetical protein
MAYASAADRARAIDTVARTIMGEAANQSYEGKLAVGNVIANRAAANFSGYGTDLVSQAKAPSQFSAWNSLDNGGNKLVGKRPNAEAIAAATAVVDGTAPDNTNGATHYNVASGAGVSAKGKARQAAGTNVSTIGDHTFYTTDVTAAQRQAIADRYANPQSPTFNPAMSPAQMAVDNSSAPLAPQTPSERMWGAVQSVLGAPVTAAMRAGQIGVDIGLGLADQAAKIAQNSAQQQPNNPAADSPANRMRSAVGLPAHPSTPTPGQTAPIGQVSRGPDLAAPADRMHAAIQSQYGGPTAAADAAKAQGISYSPNFDQTFADSSSNTPAPGSRRQSRASLHHPVDPDTRHGTGSQPSQRRSA